jgi:hypothetical protein
LEGCTPTVDNACNDNTLTFSVGAERSACAAPIRQNGVEAASGDSRHSAASGGIPLVPTDPELAAVAEAWATLPPAIKAGILAMVRSTGGA